MDEIALFWKITPDRTLFTEKLSGKKKEKARISVAVTCSSDGSCYFLLWLIGKSTNLRCFRKGAAIKGFDFTYRNNNKAWMTGDIMIEYLKWLNKRVSPRKVLLLLDGFSAYEVAVKKLEEDRELTNIK